ncbi:MAG: SDR family oxidoreductase [Deltaproteobacteria bacterium]|nr:SDR family oxidoreductase [Deltaproteobacteria bacterium]
MDFFRGKAVYITGGSSGIGFAAARLLAGFGAHVAISARGKERLEVALQEMKRAARAPHQKLLAIACDVSDPKECARATQETLAGLGGCDVVVANAGVTHPSRVLETPDEVYERMMRINYFGTVHTVRAFLPHLFAQRRGRIGIVSSMLGFMGIYGYSAYAASKFAQVGFAECLRQECLDHGVGITLLYPPDTDTPQLAEENKIKPPETKAIAGEVKTMSPEDVAGELLAGIASGALNVVPGGMGKLTYLAKRVAPGLVNWVTDGALKKYRRAHADRP